jgi:hypothetical protein
MRQIKVVFLVIVGFVMVSCTSAGDVLPTVAVLPTAEPKIEPTASATIISSPLPTNLMILSVAESGVVPALNLTSSSIALDDLVVDVTGAELYTQIKRRSPNNDVFIVVHGILKSVEGKQICVENEDVRLTLDGVSYDMQPSVAGDYQSTLQDKIDYPGSFLGHCINSEELTFFVFDIPLLASTVRLNILSESVVLSIVMSTPVPSATPTSTNTPAPINLMTLGMAESGVG